MLDKFRANFGGQAWDALGMAGYLRYLGWALLAAGGVVAGRSLLPVDRSASGVITLRDVGSGRTLEVALDAYAASDRKEGTYAFGGIREIWFRDVYFSPFALPARLGCVIDLGANRGLFSMRAALRAERVIAVEAQAQYRDPMEQVLRANRLGNVELINAYIGAEAKLGRGDIETIQLASVVARAAGLPLDLVKVDIEGSEFGLDLEALSEARRVAMEVHPQYGEPSALVARLEALGFECRIHGSEFLHAINRRFPEARWSERA